MSPVKLHRCSTCPASAGPLQRRLWIDRQLSVPLSYLDSFAVIFAYTWFRTIRPMILRRVIYRRGPANLLGEHEGWGMRSSITQDCMNVTSIQCAT